MGNTTKLCKEGMTDLKQNVDDIYSKGFNSAEQSNSVYNEWLEYDEQVLGEGRWTGHSMGASCYLELYIRCTSM